ncbi:MAG: hypothetical protein WC942_01415 [Clostridia bacterium]|jgi:hypothetical protein
MENKSSKSLSAIIVAYRTLGICKEHAKDSMRELMKRKLSGDSFDYESYISEKIDIAKSNATPNEDMIKALNSIANIGSLK